LPEPEAEDDSATMRYIRVPWAGAVSGFRPKKHIAVGG